MCCIEKNGKKIRPKYIVSTATIRNAGEQIKFLYGRNEFAQFPPSGFDTRDLDQVTLVMKMEKESDDKSAEKSAENSAENSADLKNREGMALSERHQQILAIMEAGIEYSTEQVAEKIGLKGPRTRQLLNELVNKELLACIGTTKRRRYIKPVD